MTPPASRRRCVRRSSYPLFLEGLENRCLPSAGYGQVNLASDIPGLARTTDPNLLGPWGMVASPTGPFWFADSGSGISDLVDGRGDIVPLVVTVPSPLAHQGLPAGIVFNPGAGFVVSANGIAASGQFLFGGLDGTISAWAPSADSTQAILAVKATPGTAFTGLALVPGQGSSSLLYAADFGNGTIDVFDDRFQPVTSAGAFQDPGLPANYAPFNIQYLDQQLFVTFAQKDPASGMDVPGAAHGYVDVFTGDGHLVTRFASQGALNSPWGLAQAPADFGPLGGSVLIGNNGDGQINAYDPTSGAFLGTLTGTNNLPISLPNLWSITFGNDHEAGAANTLFFTAAPDGQHGLFGAIQAPDRIGADTGGAGWFDPTFPGERPDYPLPPGYGPAQQFDHDEFSLPVSVLLPLAESSLAIAPTLADVSLSAGRQPPSGPSLAVSVNQPAVSAWLASGAILLLPSADSSQAEPTAPDLATQGLNRFLDVDALMDASPGMSLQSAPNSSFAARELPRSTTTVPMGPITRASAPPPPSVAVQTITEEARESPLPSARTQPARSTGDALRPERVLILPANRATAASDPATVWWKLVTNVSPVLATGLIWSVIDRRRRKRQQCPTAIEMLPTRAC